MPTRSGNAQILGGGGNQGQTPPPPVQTDDILGGIFGGQLTGASSGTADTPRPQLPEETVKRGRMALDGVLGGCTSNGGAADDLLSSVDSAVRGLR